MPFDPVIPFKKNLSLKNYLNARQKCARMFIAALIKIPEMK